MKGLPAETDFVVIGAGVAGVRAALELAAAGRVLVLAKKEAPKFHAQAAPAGMTALLSDEDEISLHLQNTLRAGDGLCDPAAVKALVEEGPQRIDEVIAWGTQFDRNGTRLVFEREGAQLRNRILHAQGESTRREIRRALCAKAHSLKNISLAEFVFSTRLRVDDGRVTGISLIDGMGVSQVLPAPPCCSPQEGRGGSIATPPIRKRRPRTVWRWLFGQARKSATWSLSSFIPPRCA